MSQHYAFNLYPSPLTTSQMDKLTSAIEGADKAESDRKNLMGQEFVAFQPPSNIHHSAHAQGYTCFKPTLIPPGPPPPSVFYYPYIPYPSNREICHAEYYDGSEGEGEPSPPHLCTRGSKMHLKGWSPFTSNKGLFLKK